MGIKSARAEVQNFFEQYGVKVTEAYRKNDIVLLSAITDSVLLKDRTDTSKGRLVKSKKEEIAKTMESIRTSGQYVIAGAFSKDNKTFFDIFAETVLPVTIVKASERGSMLLGSENNRIVRVKDANGAEQAYSVVYPLFATMKGDIGEHNSNAVRFAHAGNLYGENLQYSNTSYLTATDGAFGLQSISFDNHPDSAMNEYMHIVANDCVSAELLARVLKEVNEQTSNHFARNSEKLDEKIK